MRPATAGVDNAVAIEWSSVSASSMQVSIKPYIPDLSLRWESVSTGLEVVPS